jgi:broad specificity phosphatase PhoE
MQGSIDFTFLLQFLLVYDAAAVHIANFLVPQELEQQHEGRHIVLVSHGDTLSILQATFHGTSLAQHRQYGLGTAELKQLNGSNGSRQAAVSSEAEAGPAAAAAAAAAAAVEAVVAEPVCKPELVLSAASS